MHYNRKVFSYAVFFCDLPPVTSNTEKEVNQHDKCHHTSIQGNGFKSLAEGDQVSFETENGPKGPKAINVVKL
jgi:cold shock CspA family protein